MIIFFLSPWKSKHENIFTENNKRYMYEVSSYEAYFYDISDIHFFFFLHEMKLIG